MNEVPPRGFRNRLKEDSVSARLSRLLLVYASGFRIS